MCPDPFPAQHVSQEFRSQLNRHGYAFQHAVIRRVQTLAAQGLTPWRFEAAEFPVMVGGANTHIDFILRAGDTDLYLVAECKRVDPSLARWGFARAPFTRRESTEDQLVLEELRPHESRKICSLPFGVSWSDPPYHVGLELKTGTRGDGSGGGRDTIERAAAQVLRGVNGLVNHYASFDWATLSGRYFRFIPAVFTTAEIWRTDADISAGDLNDGRVGESNFVAEPASWLWVNYNLSPALRHDVPFPDPQKTLADTLMAEFTRSIAIVSPSGVDTFLRMDLAIGL